jgi:hypothetical protein
MHPSAASPRLTSPGAEARHEFNMCKEVLGVCRQTGRYPEAGNEGM